MSGNTLARAIYPEKRVGISTVILAGLAGGLAVRNWRQAKRIRELEHEVRHDALTGLLTKEAVREEVQQRLEKGLPTGLALLDMDAFKKVNDTLGHGMGDSLLSGFGQHLRENFRRSSDRVAHERIYTPQGTNGEDALTGRNGGDEFVVVFDLNPRDSAETRQSDEIMSQSCSYLRAVVNDFVDAQPADIQSVGFGVSIGSAYSTPEQPQSLTDLYGLADAALYVDKELRGGAR